MIHAHYCLKHMDLNTTANAGDHIRTAGRGVRVRNEWIVNPVTMGPELGGASSTR